MAEKLINLWQALESAFRKFTEAGDKPAPESDREGLSLEEEVNEATDKIPTIEKLIRRWKK